MGLLVVSGFDSGQPILYLSTESSDAPTAVLERATFVPLVAQTPYAGGDDFFGSARERIFPFINGQSGTRNAQAQGLVHLIKDGHATEWDATFGMWTPKAVARGLNRRQTDEFELLHLAATRPDLLTGPEGQAYGSTNVLINCPVIAFTRKEPNEDRVKPRPGDAVDTFRSYRP